MENFDHDWFDDLHELYFTRCDDCNILFDREDIEQYFKYSLCESCMHNRFFDKEE